MEQTDHLNEQSYSILLKHFKAKFYSYKGVIILVGTMTKLGHKSIVSTRKMTPTKAKVAFKVHIVKVHELEKTKIIKNT